MYYFLHPSTMCVCVPQALGPSRWLLGSLRRSPSVAMLDIRRPSVAPSNHIAPAIPRLNMSFAAAVCALAVLLYGGGGGVIPASAIHHSTDIFHGIGVQHDKGGTMTSFSAPHRNTHPQEGPYTHIRAKRCFAEPYNRKYGQYYTSEGYAAPNITRHWFLCIRQ